MHTYSYHCTNQITDDIFQEILNIRKEHFYIDPLDVRYWNGGIQSLLTSESMKVAHINDSSSRFILVYRNTELIAYSRFSINYKKYADYSFSKLHIIVCKKSLIGKEIEIAEQKYKIGKFLIEQVINECQSQNSTVLVSEICIYPYPNMPSLVLHEKYGFLPLTDDLKSSSRDNIKNKFLVLGKILKTDIELPELIALKNIEI